MIARPPPGIRRPHPSSCAHRPGRVATDALQAPRFRVDAYLFRVAYLPPRAASLDALPEQERRLASRMASPPRRESFVAARCILRAELGRRLGCRAAEVPILRPCDGKPRLAYGGIEFSLSHAGGWIALALSADGAVGVDVEPLRRLAGMREIASEFFPQEARAGLAAASPGERPVVFLRWWTRIEAAVKASGRGLDDAPDCFDGVSFESCDLVPGLASAVAARTRRPLAVRWHVLDASRVRR